MSPGIPPSLERREFLLRAAAVGAALALAAAAIIFAMARPLDMEPGTGAPAAAGPVSQDALLAERDRAAAYKAVRDYMHNRNWGSDIKAVYCRDSSHTVFYGGMEFQGRIDLEPHAGEMIPMDYTATVRGDRNSGWTVESATLAKPGGYSAGDASDAFSGAVDGEAGPNALMPDASTQ